MLPESTQAALPDLPCGQLDDQVLLQQSQGQRDNALFSPSEDEDEAAFGIVPSTSNTSNETETTGSYSKAAGDQKSIDRTADLSGESRAIWTSDWSLAADSFTARWRACILCLTMPIHRGLVRLSNLAARNPYTTVIFTILLSGGLFALGLKTNFYLEANENELWKPINSRVARHLDYEDEFKSSRNWTFPDLDEFGNIIPFTEESESSDSIDDETLAQLEQEYGPWGGRVWISTVMYAKEGNDNVVDLEGATKMFQVHQQVVETPEYVDFCARHGQENPCPFSPEDGLQFVCDLYEIPYGDDVQKTCERRGATNFYLNNFDNFQERATSDEEVQEAMSLRTFQGKELDFDIRTVIGYAEYDENEVLVYGKSYTLLFYINRGFGGDDVADLVERRLVELRDQWASDPNNRYALEIFSARSFASEFQRGIIKDLPLIPIAFFLMSAFTMFVYYKRDPLESKCAVGFGAVACILLSIVSGYGLLFCIGTPLTVLTQLLPFIMFGIGLDDSFIILTAFGRTNPNKTPEERIHDTMDEVAMSVFMTTATSAFAFVLGCTTSIPSVRWLCLYAFPTIIIDFIYQITFFIAVIVIDEKRRKNRRRDCTCCFRVPVEEDDTGDEEAAASPQKTKPGNERAVAEVHFSEKIMVAYSKLLLRPKVKAVVLVLFTGLFFACAWSATKMEVFFEYTSILPQDSYLINFNKALAEKTNVPPLEPYVYFRNVDHSNPEVLDQIDEYLNELVAGMDSITQLPFRYWLHDYREFLDTSGEALSGLSFNETIHSFLNDLRYEQYRGDFLMDYKGEVIASRTQVQLDNVDMNDVDEYLGAYRQMNQVGSMQPANQGSEWSFFPAAEIFSLWAFLDVTENELLYSTIYGIFAVTVMSLLFIPHWSAAFMMTPLITILYIDLMGFIRFCGIPLNGVTFVAMVMSIGLLVDFIMHVAHRYFDTTQTDRVDKTKEVLRTMGASILLGGLSTFLGTVPLAFASNSIFFTIFITFIGIVLLGVSHGLVLFPVLLSMFGPQQ